MALATIKKVWVIRGLIDYDGMEVVRYVGFQMADARIKTVKDAWAFNSYEGAFQQLSEMVGEGIFEIMPIFAKESVEEVVEEAEVVDSGGHTSPPKVEE